jgi:hypothetical protein
VRSAYFCATAPTWVCTWLILLTGGSPLSTRLDWSVPQPRWCILLAARNVQPASCCPSVVLCNPTAQLRASKYGLRVSNREEHGVKWHKHPTVFRTPLTSTVRSPMRRTSIKTRYEGCTLSCVLSKESDRPRVEYVSRFETLLFEPLCESAYLDLRPSQGQCGCQHGLLLISTSFPALRQRRSLSSFSSF